VFDVHPPGLYSLTCLHPFPLVDCGRKLSVSSGTIGPRETLGPGKVWSGLVEHTVRGQSRMVVPPEGAWALRKQQERTSTGARGCRRDGGDVVMVVYPGGARTHARPCLSDHEGPLVVLRPMMRAAM
jgi:hypothetical protein